VERALGGKTGLPRGAGQPRASFSRQTFMNATSHFLLRLGFLSVVKGGKDRIDTMIFVLRGKGCWWEEVMANNFLSTTSLMATMNHTR